LEGTVCSVSLVDKNLCVKSGICCCVTDATSARKEGFCFVTGGVVGFVVGSNVGIGPTNN